MQFPEILETDRLLLRPWRESDAAACCRWASDPRVGRMCGWKPHESEEESLEVIRSILSTPLTYAVTVKGSDEAIGSIDLHPTTRPETMGHLALGYWLGAPHWGNGYIPEAGRALLDTAFSLGAREIWVSHFADNHQSRRVIHKLGFTYRFRDTEQVGPSGEEKELWYYSILPGEYTGDS